MLAIFKQSNSGNYPFYLSYFGVTLIIPLIFLSLFLLALGGVKYLLPLLIFNLIVLLPGIAIDYFIFIKPFKNKVHPDESVELKADGIELKSNTKTQTVPFDSISSIEFLNYFVNLGVFIFSLGSFIKKLGIFKITTTNSDIYLPPSYAERDALLQQIIEKSNLKKQHPTTSSNIRRGLFVWQREAGLYYSRVKSSESITKEDLKIDVYTETQTKIGYLAIFVFGIMLLLLTLILIAPDFLNKIGECCMPI